MNAKPNNRRATTKHLSSRLALLGSIIVFVGGFLGASAVITYQYLESQQALQNKIEAIIDAAETSTAQALYHLDRSTLKEIIHGLTAYPEVSKAQIYELNGLFDESSSTPSSASCIWTSIVHKISDKEIIFNKTIREPTEQAAVIGKLILTVDPALVLVPSLKQGGNFIIIFLLVHIALFVAGGVIARRLVTRPLGELSRLISNLDPSAQINQGIAPSSGLNTIEFKSLVNSTNKFLFALNQHLREREHYENGIIKAEQEAKNAQLQLVDALESIHDGFILRNKEQQVILCNSRFLSFYPAASALVSQQSTYDIVLRAIAESDIILDEPIEKWVAARDNKALSERITYEEQLTDGRQIKITEMRTPTGGIVGIHRDITELKIAENNLRYRADYDVLTGLLNRSSLMQHLAEAISRSERTHSKAAVLFIDLDRFKNVNDTLGHAIGDQLLQEAGERIKTTIRKTDCAARLGGDEFAVILSDIKDELSCARIAEKIIKSLSQTFNIQAREIFLSASIGVSVYPLDGDEPDMLLRHADMAMYQAKQDNRGIVKFFNEEMTIRAEKFVRLEQDLRHAIQNNEFVLNFQPIMPLEAGSETGISTQPPAGVEVLVRWDHPTRGIVPPGEFIDVAEETGQIASIGEWVLLTACQQAMSWIDRYPCYLSVNVSYRQFQKGFDSRVVKRILAETGFPANRLYLEITESLLIADDKRMLRVLSELRNIGVRIAIDDFGTGYSSLSYLKQYPINMLKIDKAFISDMHANSSNEQLVETIIAMAKGMNLNVVAEGVETFKHVEMLRKLQCDMLQGFYFSKPLPQDKLMSFLETTHQRKCQITSGDKTLLETQD